MRPNLSRTAIVTAIAFVLGTLYGGLVRGYPWLLAFFLGAAIAALVYSIQRTTDRLREARAQRTGAPPE